MTLRVKYFGEVEERTGTSDEVLPKEVSSLVQLLDFLRTRYGIETETIKVAVNHSLVTMENDIALKETDELAILSPFAGG